MTPLSKHTYTQMHGAGTSHLMHCCWISIKKQSVGRSAESHLLPSCIFAAAAVLSATYNV